MRKMAFIMLFWLLLIIAEPIALSDNGSNLNSNDLCGILGVILIIVVIIIGLFIVFSDYKNKQIDKIDKQQESSRYCPDCGRAISFDTKFCPSCRRRF